MKAAELYMVATKIWEAIECKDNGTFVALIVQ